MSMPQKARGHIAANTFGLGAKDGELSACASDPQGWLLEQIKAPDNKFISNLSLKSTEENLSIHFEDRKKILDARKGDTSSKTADDTVAREIVTFRREIGARQNQALATSTPFAERWALFWSNHFCVAARSHKLRCIVGSHEREAIRPHVFSDFHTLAKAAIFHPAMMYYLNNDTSIGPNSRLGKRTKNSYNENLGREILELHTVGLGAGYSPQDIIEFSKALTGWSIHPQERTLFFMKGAHERGPKTVMGKSFDLDGEEQAPAILQHLCSDDNTADFIARKLARTFVGTNAPQSVIDALRICFLDTQGDLSQLAKILITHEASWSSNEWRYKTPFEFAISAGRALKLERLPAIKINGESQIITDILGQTDLTPPSPEGWADIGDHWINGENLARRIEWLSVAVNTAPNWINEAYLAQQFVSQSSPSPAISTFMKEVLTRRDMLRGLLMSPEFLMR